MRRAGTVLAVALVATVLSACSGAGIAPVEEGPAPEAYGVEGYTAHDMLSRSDMVMREVAAVNVVTETRVDGVATERAERLARPLRQWGLWPDLSSDAIRFYAPFSDRLSGGYPFGIAVEDRLASTPAIEVRLVGFEDAAGSPVWAVWYRFWEPTEDGVIEVRRTDHIDQDTLRLIWQQEERHSPVPVTITREFQYEVQP